MPFIQSCVSFLILGGLSRLAVAQDQSAQFNQVVNLNGNMQLNRITFPDNSKIETFSQTQRQLIVNQNPNSLSANHVVGSTGQPFVQLSQNSMTIATNNATDLVGAQIELAMDPAVLSQNNISADNTFVAMLSSDRQAWIVMEGIKSVNSTDSTVRMVKLNSIDGEYMAIGRQTTETSNVLTPFGSQPVNISGSGIQEVEFTDGFRMSIKATQPMTVQTNVVNGVSSSMTSNGNIMTVNNFRYLVTTNLAGVTPGLNQMAAVVQLPLNANLIMQMATSMGIGANGSMVIGIAQRGVVQNPGGATGGTLSPQKERRSLGRRASKSSSLTDTTKSATSKAGRASSSSVADAASSPSDTAPSSSATDAASSPSDTPASDTNSTQSDGAAAASTSASPESAAAASSTSPSQETASASSASDTSASATPTSQGQGSTSGQQPADAQPQAQNSPSGTSPQNPAATQLLLSPTFTPVNAQVLLDQTAGRVAVPVTQLSGEFILTMGKAGTGSTTGSTTGAGSGSTQPQSQPLQPQQRRQFQQRQSQNPVAQSGVVMSMVDLQSMIQRQRNGGAAFMATEVLDQAFPQRR